LRKDSVCIDSGDPNSILWDDELDIDGDQRLLSEVVDIGADEFVEVPYIHISPERIEFHAYQDGSIPENKSISIETFGPNAISWTVDEECSWLDVSDVNGVSSGQMQEVMLSVNLLGLERGIHMCEVTIASDEAVNSPQTIEVVLQVDAVIYVPSEYETIQRAIDAAEDWTTIIVANGRYTGGGNRDLDFRGKSITVRSASGPENCIIDCEGEEGRPHRGFYFHRGEGKSAVLEGFTITNGYARGTDSERHGGGSIRCDDSSPVIKNCIFLSNRAAWDGGAVNNLNSNPTFINCSFIGNSAINNDGGGMNNDNSSPVLINCIFRGNSAFDWGGGIRNINSSDARLTNCLFVNNSSDEGAAIFNYDGSNPTIINCTFTGNIALTGGGGIESRERCGVTVSNSIVWGNEGAAMFGSHYSVSYSNIQGGWPGAGNMDVNPLFSQDDEDFELSEGSPCIDSGENSRVLRDLFDLDDDGRIRELLPFDLTGNTRIEDGNSDGKYVIDMGAYEYVPLVECAMRLTPRVLNLRSKGKYVKGHIVLPEGYAVEDVDVGRPCRMTEPFEPDVESENVRAFVNDEGYVEIEATFARSGLCSAGSFDGSVTVVGKLADGMNYMGIASVRVVDRRFERMAEMADYWLRADCRGPDWCAGLDENEDGVVNFADFALLKGCCID
jgi:hypothetical protein